MSYNILIVDDAAFVREAFVQICEEAGHMIVGEASNGEEAIELAKKLNPQVIIMDMVMPLKNGIEAAKEILETNNEIKIIACSTVDQEFVVTQAMQVGCVSYIYKPFKKNQVIDAINEIKVVAQEIGG